MAASGTARSPVAASGDRLQPLLAAWVARGHSLGHATAAGCGSPDANPAVPALCRGLFSAGD